MGKGFNSLAAVVASLISRSNRKKALKKIDKVNETNRNIHRSGNVSVDQILPLTSSAGNLCFSGGTQEHRNRLIVQNCLQSCSAGIPTVVLHEGNTLLEQALGTACGNQPYFRQINPAAPYYDPIFRLSDTDAATTLVNAALPERKIDTTGVLYLTALNSLLRKKGIPPYTRMLATCPHNSIQTVIQNEEQVGHLTSAEATGIRNDLIAGESARGSLEYFFSQLQGESEILAWKNHLSRCTSIAECVRAKGVLVMDVGTTNKRTQLALIAAEIQRCMSNGQPLRIIVDAVSLLGNENLRDLFKTFSGTLAWTLSCPDLCNMVSTTDEELSSWVAQAHKTVLFSHRIHTAQLLSNELGDYEYIEVTQSHAGNNSIGMLGYHFGANNNISTTNRRERVIKPEEIESLVDGEFFLLDNNTAMLCHGQLQ